ncbi:MAG: MurR/RpiR family transcriptional regulator [Anaerolineae bacterium]|nr:MAG: MurR/RpiR family transcriptional regulator [Anaerolineae bacterium]
MSYVDLIRDNRPAMSKSFAKLADFILDSHVQAALMTATEIAHQVDVDAATVVRFAQRLGYSGFPELQIEIKDRVLNELLMRSEAVVRPDSPMGVAEMVLGELGRALEQTRMLMDAGAVTELVEGIGEARRIIIVPESLGQAAAYNLMNLLEQGGFMVTIAQAAVNDLARAVSTATKDDLILAIDVSGDAPFIARALSEASAVGIATAAIVGAASHPSAQSARLVLAAPSQTSLGVTLVVVDALVNVLAESLRWHYKERFAGADKALEALFARIQSPS